MVEVKIDMVQEEFASHVSLNLQSTSIILFVTSTTLDDV